MRRGPRDVLDRESIFDVLVGLDLRGARTRRRTIGTGGSIGCGPSGIPGKGTVSSGVTGVGGGAVKGGVGESGGVGGMGASASGGSPGTAAGAIHGCATEHSGIGHDTA